MKKILTALLVLCMGSMYAQVTFEKGYFITNDGTRTTCLIENQEWRDNPTSFVYKLDESGEKKTQNIFSVKEFGVDNVSQYKRFKVKIEYSKSETNNLSKNRSPEWKEETLFLQALVTGDANLYVYSNSNVTKYFYEAQTVPIEQLVRIRYMSTEAVSGFEETIQENNQFRQQLFNNARCANTADADFENLQYKKAALVKHFTAYNSCKGTAKNPVDFTAKDKDRDVFVLRVTPGLFKGRVEANDAIQFYNMSTEFDATIVKFGLEAEYIFPFGKNRWSIFVNPTYQKMNKKNTVVRQESYTNGGNPITYHEELTFSSIEFPIGVRRYFFLSPDSKILADFGLMIETTLGDNSINYTNTDNLFNATLDLPLKSGTSLFLGVGYNYKRFGGEFRFYMPRTITDIETFDVKYSSYGSIVSYKIF